MKIRYMINVDLTFPNKENVSLITTDLLTKKEMNKGLTKTDFGYDDCEISVCVYEIDKNDNCNMIDTYLI